MSRILFMCGKKIGYEISRFLQTQKDHEIRYLVNDYESTSSWYDTPRKLGVPEITEKDISSFDPDLLIVAFYDRILKEDTFRRPRLGAWNLHLADAERYRGAYPTIWAIRNGDKTYGVTLHLIDKGIDTGPIL